MSNATDGDFVSRFQRVSVGLTALAPVVSFDFLYVRRSVRAEKQVNG
jgi:hypothetical protein